MFKLTSILIMLLGSSVPQYVQTAYSHPAAGATPGFVNETSKNSTLTNSVTTEVAGTTTCGNITYCIPYADPVLAGNLGVLFVQYNHATTALTVTAADDKSDTYTCGAAGAQVQIGSGFWVDYCYSMNMTAGAHIAKITFSAAATQVMAKAQQFNNIATTSALDAVTLCAGTSSTTANCAAVTTTAANDLVDVYVARVATPNTTSFTSGTGYTLGTTDILDGGATEYGVVSGTGSTTPAMTMATASTYGEVALAFKAASAGTAPTGWYLAHLMSWSYESTTAGNRAFQFPTSGNLLVNANSCNTVQPTSITDANNTWTSAGTLFAGSGNNTIEFYSANASADASGALTVNAASVAGDCSYQFYDFVGAPSAPVVTRATYDARLSTTTVGFASGVQTLPPYTLFDSGSSTYANVGLYNPMPTTGKSIFVGGQQVNTSTAVSAPSACIFDAATQGGENLSGPWPVDQNNPFGHCSFSGTTGAPIAWNQTSSTNNPGGFSGDIVSFNASASVGLVHSLSVQGGGATFLESTALPSTISGNLFVVVVGIFNSTARTATKVCLGGNSTCGTGTQLTECTSCVSTGSGHGATSIWFTTSAPSAATQIDVVASGTASAIEFQTFEVFKGSGSWAIDGNGAQTTNGTGSGTTLTGPSFTSTGSVDFCATVFSISQNIRAIPITGNEFNFGGTIWTNTTDGAASLITTTAGAHSATATDSTSADSFSASIQCYK